MREDDGEVDSRRSFVARLGVTLLNLLTPGLGLVRVGRIRTGLAFALCLALWVLALILVALLAPQPSPRAFLIVTLCSLALAAAVYVGSLVLTWMNSKHYSWPRRWWSRWYGLVAFFVLVQLAAIGVVAFAHSVYKPFYTPAESMSPTLEVGDRFLAAMSDRRRLRRGDLILLDVRGHIYIKRVVALAGDHIAMRAGVPMLNGAPAMQQAIGEHRVSGADAILLTERLPGEDGEHRVLDLGVTQFDEMPEVMVPLGHVFVLGDNRDMSADSRVPRAMGGVEMLPVQDVRGRPLFRTWDENYRWLGSSID